LPRATSRTAARLVPTVDEALWHAEPPLKDLNPFWSMTLDAVLAHLDEFDVIHSHLDYWGFPLVRCASAPVLTTLHGRLDLPELQPLYRRFRDVPLVSISDAQREPVRWANFVATVYHGIELDQLTPRFEPGQFLAFLGRISPEKGLDNAIKVAQRADWRLRIAPRKPLRHDGDPFLLRHPQPLPTGKHEVPAASSRFWPARSASQPKLSPVRLGQENYQGEDCGARRIGDGDGMPYRHPGRRASLSG
jgi:glycosyltransferase involved in cell wall biosynthesis